MNNDITMNPGEIIFLLGAGASFDANIPISNTMLEQLEKKLDDVSPVNEWKDYKNLYYCIKSGIQYGIGITNRSVDINIESIINTIDELLKSYEHPIYPFVGSWVPRLTELAGKEFENIKIFRSLILEQLKVWMEIKHDEICNYYSGLIKFQKEYEYPLSIFSLNYDKCLEIQCKNNNVELNRGFDTHKWSYKNFDKPNDSIAPINLYKIHGSIDWELKDNIVLESNGTIEKLAIIFGTSYKLQYIDPFLFLFYEFRRQTLESATKYIVCIGYSFNDEHINGILKQAIIKDSSKKIISIQPFSKNDNANQSEIDNEREKLCVKLGLKKSENVLVVNSTAKKYLENEISKDFFIKYQDTNDIPF